MHTFTVPPDLKDNERLRFNPIQARLEEVLKDDVEMSYILPKVFQILEDWFPLDFLAFTSATDNPSEEQYHIHPEAPAGKTRLLRMSTAMEQIQVLSLGEACVVKVGDQSDHSVTVGFLNQFFQDKPYSILLIRFLIENRTICTVSLLSKRKHVFSNLHVKRAFSLRDTLNRFLERKCANQCTGTDSSTGSVGNPRYLPIIALPGMNKVNKQIWQVARQNCPVLLYGETGTGKEVVANAIYSASTRIHGPFIKINCGSIPDNLIDSELFGHERGAYTDAFNTVQGCFERASRGVLLLDEVGELPLLAQTRLLRVLEENLIKRIGGVEEISVDVRIVAATHKNLAEMVENNKFREDLFYRLNVFLLQIPPLRERPEDIPPLIDFFIQQRTAQHASIAPPVLDPDHLDDLCNYPWPGNIRELQNAVESAVIRWISNPNKKLHVEFKLNRIQSSNGHCVETPCLIGDTSEDSIFSLDECIARHIRKALHLSGGKISGPGGAAEHLKIHHNTLRAKIKKLGIQYRQAE